jgi:tRNA dimethylallyltransferase
MKSKTVKLIAIVGPTASGKSARAIEVARYLARTSSGEVEIVSPDSRQLYRGMDIGTAKPSAEEMTFVPHHLINIKDPDEEYTVATYKKDATAAIDAIVKRGNIPLLVGGTGLYVSSVVDNLEMPKLRSDPALRAKIEKDIEKEGLPSVFKKLLALDPDAIGVVDPKNPRRVIRALEVALITGMPFTAQRTKSEPLYDTLVLGMSPSPEVLRERINKRIDEMLHGGFVAEVTKLMKRYGPRAVAFDAIGYREIVNFLNAKITFEEAVAQMKMNTWHYAKRQLTWFKKDKKIHWVHGFDETIAEIKNFLV